MSTTTFTAEYVGIEAALLAACERLKRIEEELRDFVPKTRPQVIAELKIMQPLEGPPFEQWSEGQKETWYNERVEPYLETRYQIDALIGKRYRAEYAVIIVMSAALAEAMINVVMQNVLAITGKERLFPLCDKWPIIEKWRYGPQVAIESYSFSTNSETYRILRGLVSARNNAIHCRGSLTIDGTTHFHGKSMFQQTPRQQLPWLKKVANLPIALYRQLHQSLHSDYWPPLMLELEEPFPEHSIKVE